MDFLPADLFVKPVDGHDDLVAFQYGFALEGKAAGDTFVTELDDGDLLIEGWAADFTGDDREGENFTDGAFTRGIKSFLTGQASLCFHHQNDKGIGRVLDLKEVEGKGLYMKARVDKQEPTSPLYYIYNAIKKGTYRGLSVGGFFKRKYVEGKRRIADMDFTEISVTPVPVHPGTGFSVVAGKALEGMTEEPVAVIEATPELEAAVEKYRNTVEQFKALAEKPEPETETTD